MCTIAIPTQEGSNAAREWNDKRQDSRESSTKRKNKSRKNIRAHTRKKRGGTSKATAEKLDSPGPTPEALVCIKLRQVEENQLAAQTQESIGIEGNRIDDGPYHEAEDDHNEEVRSDR